MFSKHCLCLVIQLHPIEATVLRIWINTHDRSIKPALAPPNFGIQKDLNPVTDLEALSHLIHFLRAAQMIKPIPTTIMMLPLIAHWGSPVMELPGRMLMPCRKNVPPDKMSNIPRMFKNIFIAPSSKVCAIITSANHCAPRAMDGAEMTEE